MAASTDKSEVRQAAEALAQTTADTPEETAALAALLQAAGNFGASGAAGGLHREHVA